MPTEKEAAEELRKRIDDAKMNAYDTARHYSKMNEAELKNCGHKTREGAILFTIQYAEQKIEKMIREHETKFP